jgi:hypothetical protein
MITSFEIGEFEYELEFDFRPGCPPSRDDPGDGPEVDPEKMVTVYRDGKRTDQVVTFEEFTVLYAAEHQILPSSAEDQILAKLCEVGEQDWADRYEDRDGDNWRDE